MKATTGEYLGRLLSPCKYIVEWGKMMEKMQLFLPLTLPISYKHKAKDKFTLLGLQIFHSFIMGSLKKHIMNSCSRYSLSKN